MAISSNATKLANLFNPQVVGDLINKKLVDAIRFSPLAHVDHTLVGRPGSTLTLPSYAYIGDAEVVAEGADIPIAQLTQDTVEVTIHKIGKGVQITDEAVLSGFGSPEEEAVSQLLTSLGSQGDNEMLAALEGIGAAMTHTGAAVLTAENVADALVKFGEDIDGAKVLLCNPADYNALRKASDWVPASEVAANMIIHGAVGMVHGCQVVISNKLANKPAFIVKPGALRLILKRDILVETDRDIVNKSTVITADKHSVAYLYDASKAIKIARG
jgi:N4-gp56 family major capsid protein